MPRPEVTAAAEVLMSTITVKASRVAPATVITEVPVLPDPAVTALAAPAVDDVAFTQTTGPAPYANARAAASTRGPTPSASRTAWIVPYSATAATVPLEHVPISACRPEVSCGSSPSWPS